MTPFQRLNSLMPFIILSYLMMSLAQLHVTPSMHAIWNDARARNLISSVRIDFSAVTKNARLQFQGYDARRYTIGDFVPP